MHKPLLTLATAASLLFGAASGQAENLQDVYRLALENDPQLRAAEAAWRAAQEALPQSRSALLPTISAGINLTHNRQDIGESATAPTGTENYNSGGYSLSLNQPLWDKTTRIALKQAEASVTEAEAQLGSARQGLIYRAAEAYFEVLAAQDNLDFAKAEKRAIEQQLRQTQQRFEVGLTAITDVHEAQARYDLSVSQEITAQNQLDTAREALREITAT